MSEVEVLSIEAVWEAKAILGEGPLYDPRCESLLWVDIKGEKLFRLNTKTKKQESWRVSGNLSALGLARNEGYICVMRTGFHYLRFTPEPELEFIADPESEIFNNRFNDGAVDPFGGFWAGTMDDSEQDASAGTWWRLGPDREAQAIARGFHVTNGPVFDSKRSCVYYTDSARQIIYRASIHPDGSISEESVFVTFKPDQGYPDGMAIDADGVLWVAFWDGWCLRRIGPQGDILQQIDMPVPRPTKVALTEKGLYVSSASIGLNEEALNVAPLSGSLFFVELSDSVSLKMTQHYYGPETF